jgi:hypothetical protein
MWSIVAVSISILTPYRLGVTRIGLADTTWGLPFGAPQKVYRPRYDRNDGGVRPALKPSETRPAK